jgi:hypothetical protein
MHQNRHILGQSFYVGHIGYNSPLRIALFESKHQEWIFLEPIMGFASMVWVNKRLAWAPSSRAGDDARCMLSITLKYPGEATQALYGCVSIWFDGKKLLGKKNNK